VRFWDSSAIVPLFVAEASSARMEELLREDAHIVAWWGTPLECLSALARRERDGDIASAQVTQGAAALVAFAASWVEVAPATRVRDIAARLIRVHDLRAADALQLAAAIQASGEHETRMQLVTLDERLALAASREGFDVLGLGACL
jgi:predicted nucleic acid-binding protein